jgi:hypothetical protein
MNESMGDSSYITSEIAYDDINSRYECTYVPNEVA